MKTWRLFLLSGAILAGLLCGCGKAPPENKPVPGDTPQTAPKQPKAEVNTVHINDSTASSTTTYAVAAASQNNANAGAKSETHVLTVAESGAIPHADAVQSIARNEGAVAIAVPTPVLPAPALAEPDRLRLTATQGSKVRIDGTANMIHTRWAVEGKLIGGFVDAGPNFLAPQTANPGNIEAKVEAFIPVRSLKSIDDDGKPFSDNMDDIMYNKLKAQDFPKIFYRLHELLPRNTSQNHGTSYTYDAKGELVVAGVTNYFTLPVSVQPLGSYRVRIFGSTELKMTQFRIQPPEVNLVFGKLKTGDTVKVSVEWMVEQKKTVAAASQ
jgi:hypothetical protein